MSSLTQPSTLGLSLLSFGYKHGVPADCNFIIDVRCLKNPYWEPTLSPYTGQHPDVRDFLKKQPETEALCTDIASFIQAMLKHFQNKADRRLSLNVGIGCTGGQHRSVYVTEFLRDYFASQTVIVDLHHRELLL
jgi:UPF0042 nucleotide-binding protein